MRERLKRVALLLALLIAAAAVPARAEAAGARPAFIHSITDQLSGLSDVIEETENQIENAGDAVNSADGTDNAETGGEDDGEVISFGNEGNGLSLPGDLEEDFGDLTDSLEEDLGDLAGDIDEALDGLDGVLDGNAGETEEVLALLDEAAEVYRSAPEEARNEQLLLIKTYHSRQQALVRLRLGRTEEAEQYRKRMHEEMELYFRRCGTDGPRLLDLRETDIEFERAAGNLSEAARHLEENMRGYVLYRGPEHEDTLKCMEQLADILSDGSRARENLREDLRRARGLYLQVAAGVRSHYPYESEWLLRVEKKIREQMIQGL